MEVIGVGARARVAARRGTEPRVLLNGVLRPDSNISNGLFRASYLNAIARYLTVVWTHHGAGVSLTYPTNETFTPPSQNEERRKRRTEERGGRTTREKR